MSNCKYTIEYSDNGNKVYIIPCPTISTDDFFRISQMFIKDGFKHWLPADERRGYVFAKEMSNRVEDVK